MSEETARIHIEWQAFHDRAGNVSYGINENVLSVPGGMIRLPVSEVTIGTVLTEIKHYPLPTREGKPLAWLCSFYPTESLERLAAEKGLLQLVEQIEHLSVAMVLVAIIEHEKGTGTTTLKHMGQSVFVGIDDVMRKSDDEVYEEAAKKAMEVLPRLGITTYIED